MSSNPGEAKRIREAVKWFCLSEELLPAGSRVLAAVSGGADSVAMLSILHSLSAELDFQLAVAHFDHELRDSGDAERRMVEDYARSLGIASYAGSENVRQAAESSGDTIEEAARRARYRFLERVADDIAADRIATGHTRSDQVETILMRVLRGTGIRGLAGIPARRGRIIRPVIEHSRDEMRLYTDIMGLPVFDDPTNIDTRFFRNRIRHELLPLLRTSYHESVDTNLLRLGQNALDLVTHMRSKTQPIVDGRRQTTAGEWMIDATKVAKLDETSMVVLFGDLLAELGCDMDFNRKHYERLIRFVRDSRASGKSIDLPGVTVRREFEKLLVTRGRRLSASDDTWTCRARLTLPGETQAGRFTVQTEILPRHRVDDTAFSASGQVAYFAMSGIRLPLTLRSTSEGDRMQPFGMDGTKKLSDIFIDKKIPGRARRRAVVVEDAAQILWLVGVATSESGRVDRATERVVRIRVQPND